jgi:NADPH-dependent glutamate synthase beta subunit-like oxidoreductase
MGFVRRNFSASRDESRFAFRLGHSPIRNSDFAAFRALHKQPTPLHLNGANMAVRFGGKERKSVTFWLVRSEPPGVFAFGDVRANRVKRVASAVGVGSMAVQFIHEILMSCPSGG